MGRVASRFAGGGCDLRRGDRCPQRLQNSILLIGAGANSPGFSRSRGASGRSIFGEYRSHSDRFLIANASLFDGKLARTVSRIHAVEAQREREASMCLRGLVELSKIETRTRKICCHWKRSRIAIRASETPRTRPMFVQSAFWTLVYKGLAGENKVVFLAIGMWATTLLYHHRCVEGQLLFCRRVRASYYGRRAESGP